MTNATKTLELNIQERLAAIRMFDAFKGTTSVLSSIIDDIKQFVITEDEWKAANLTKTPSDEEVKALPDEKKAETKQVWNWTEPAELKKIEIQSPSLQYLKDEIKKRSDAGEITLADVGLVSLEKKL